MSLLVFLGGVVLARTFYLIPASRAWVPPGSSLTGLSGASGVWHRFVPSACHQLGELWRRAGAFLPGGLVNTRAAPCSRVRPHRLPAKARGVGGMARCRIPWAIDHHADGSHVQRLDRLDSPTTPTHSRQRRHHPASVVVGSVQENREVGERFLRQGLARARSVSAASDR